LPDYPDAWKADPPQGDVTLGIEREESTSLSERAEHDVTIQSTGTDCIDHLFKPRYPKDGDTSVTGSISGLTSDIRSIT
jgi:hypothetical protein